MTSMQSVICQRCKKRPATTHLTELSSAGGCLELHLCATCIQHLELRLESGPPAIATIQASEPVAKVVTAEAVADSETLAPDCPSCHMPLADFESAKRFGCAQDYTAWEDRLVPLLAEYHGADRHVGRCPGPGSALAGDLRQRRLLLDAALREAVAGEDFGTAARLRDELKQLERSMP